MYTYIRKAKKEEEIKREQETDMKGRGITNILCKLNE